MYKTTLDSVSLRVVGQCVLIVCATISLFIYKPVCLVSKFKVSGSLELQQRDLDSGESMSQGAAQGDRTLNTLSIYSYIDPVPLLFQLQRINSLACTSSDNAIIDMSKHTGTHCFVFSTNATQMYGSVGLNPEGV
jgi:hypothetical protein